MSGDLNLNKIFGAGLGTAFVILVVQQVSGAVYHTEAPEKPGYFVNAPEAAAGGEAEAAVLPVDWGTVLPTADIAAGQAAFARCQGCHNVAEGGANGTGPNLWGVVGRVPASHAGFAYSDAMKGHTSVDATWSLDALDHFITAPQKYVPGTKMSFAGLRDTATRINLIAYLRSQGSAAFPIPAPDPARQPGAAAPAEGAPTDGAATATSEGAMNAQGPNAAAPTTGPVGAPVVQESTPGELPPNTTQTPSN